MRCGIARKILKKIFSRDSRSGYATSNATGCGGFSAGAA
jgi:hypothetical protein